MDGDEAERGNKQTAEQCEHVAALTDILYTDRPSFYHHWCGSITSLASLRTELLRVCVHGGRHLDILQQATPEHSG